MIVIDGKDMILGRLVSYAAKQAIRGEEVNIVNCQDIVITGKKKDIQKKYYARLTRGDPLRGPYTQRREDRFVRRVVRGMLPYKQKKGLDAFKRVMCWIGVPGEFKDKKMETVEGASVFKMQNLKYLKVGDICKFLGKK